MWAVMVSDTPNNTAGSVCGDCPHIHLINSKQAFTFPSRFAISSVKLWHFCSAIIDIQISKEWRKPRLKDAQPGDIISAPHLSTKWLTASRRACWMESCTGESSGKPPSSKAKWIFSCERSTVLSREPDKFATLSPARTYECNVLLALNSLDDLQK